MARIKLDLPANFSFSTDIPVRIQDVNYGGHVGNDAILSIMHESRLQYLMHLGYVELDHTTNTGLIMADVAITYKGEAFHGDILKVEVTAAEFSAFGFELYYRITTTREDKTIAVAEGKTGMVCFDYNTRKVARLSHEMKASLEK
ncbi:acyl-CoA thioesterase FadM [Chitinophaga dinghuensis]|uniref:Acyl-CoA thioesterase FadM n=1 Tax=Chitinophaga dinghuensis TaxID=1539050 RepID=A0A327WD81_9BACT|nr:thioesterase family protein [Chitinophaga dinghuensis]RAJ87436.1 acyl-CoA thioesterase FadM [Chitinophaga dinghuensis]